MFWRGCRKDDLIMGKKEIKRKIFLKRQAIKVMQVDIIKLKNHLALIRLKEDLEDQICTCTDSLLRQKIDCINFLLEN